MTVLDVLLKLAGTPSWQAEALRNGWTPPPAFFTKRTGKKRDV